MIPVMAIAMLAMAGPTQRVDRQPVILDRAAYGCLMRNLNRLKPGRGTIVVDLTDCPPGAPSILEPSYAVPPNERILQVNAATLACLRRAGTRGARIAFNRNDGKVSLYLMPCGRAR